jgi:hypothetical protein
MHGNPVLAEQWRYVYGLSYNKRLADTVICP